MTMGIVERAGQSNRLELMNFSGVSTGSSSLKVDIYGRNATVWFPFRFLCLSYRIWSYDFYILSCTLHST